MIPVNLLYFDKIQFDFVVSNQVSSGSAVDLNLIVNYDGLLEVKTNVSIESLY